jgi:hypothetical protein
MEPYEIGVATAAGWWVVVVARGRNRLTIGPAPAADPRPSAAWWAVCEGVLRATMKPLHLNVPKRIHVTQEGLAARIAHGYNDDNYVGLRERLREGLFSVHWSPKDERHPVLVEAITIVRARAEKEPTDV